MSRNPRVIVENRYTMCRGRVEWMDARSAGGALLLVVVVGVGETPSLLVNVIIVIKRTCAICRWMNEIKSAIEVLVSLTNRFMILFSFGNI